MLTLKLAASFSPVVVWTFTSLEHYSLSDVLEAQPPDTRCLIQFPFISMGPPLGMSRLIRPAVLAALLITSIHLWRQDAVLRWLVHDFKKGVTMFRVLETSQIPFKGVLAFSPEEVNMGLELQFEDVLLVDAVRLFGGADRVAQQGEAGQREVILQNE